MIIEYIHPVLNEQVVAIGGHYILTKEEKIDFCGRHIVYQFGVGVFDTTCCGSGGCTYVTVPGYVVSWKERKNKNGDYVSKIEKITDESEKKEINKIIYRKELVQQVIYQ